jgi:site-specific recombinase XerD
LEDGMTTHFRDLPDWSRTTPAQLLEAHLAKPKNTAKGYRDDLTALASWLADRNNDGAATQAIPLSEAARIIIDGGRAAAKRMLIAWINDMRGQHLSAGTIRRRVASIKSLISLASDPDIEIIAWQIGKLPNLPAPGRVRSVSGPDQGAVSRMFETCRLRDDHIGARNEAIMGLLYWHGLRASEVISIRMADVNLTSSTPSVRILAKRGEGRMEICLCQAAADAIARWLEYRGDEAGLLFLRCRRVRTAKADNSPKRHGRIRYDRRLRCRKLVMSRPLSYWGMRGMIRHVGAAAGCRCWPHGLRHAAISHLAALTDDSPIWGVALSRHKDMRAWAMYQDQQVSHLSAAEVLSRGQVVRRGVSERTDN